LETVKVYKQTKYTSNNRVVQYLNRVYLRNITALVQRADPRRLLDVGCGEGVVLRHLDRRLQGVSVIGLDVDGTGLRVAQSQNTVSLVQGSVYDLPFASGSFDLVLCCEVLEHVERPEVAMAELARVSRDRVLLSVPNEPVWRLSNMARGKYLRHFGNTTGHIHHWTRWAFLRLVRNHLDVTGVRTWLPFWSMLLARVRQK
jgi:2-polyprenyl-3-methyl-5-hydroxy-6-metoxy-1,4-benzoquinol methylase